MLKEYREQGFAQGPVYSYRVLCAVQEERAVEVPLDEAASNGLRPVAKPGLCVFPCGVVVLGGPLLPLVDIGDGLAFV